MYLLGKLVQSDVYFWTGRVRDAESKMVNFLANDISSDTVVCMVLYYSGEKYYKASVPYLEELVGQTIIRDLAYGESWALLGYKGIPPVPDWRKSVRRKISLGPSTITELITLRKGLFNIQQ